LKQKWLLELEFGVELVLGVIVRISKLFLNKVYETCRKASPKGEQGTTLMVFFLSIHGVIGISIDIFKNKEKGVILMKLEKEVITRGILKIINESEEPLETKEIEVMLKNVSRVMILYRLNNLRGEGLIKGKQIGSGKGTWIWWKNGGKKEK